jgi:integrase
LIEARNKKEAFLKREALRLGLTPEADEDRRLKERMRLGEYAESWMRSKLRELKPSTRQSYASVLDLHIFPALGNYYCDMITPTDVVRWRDAQSGTPKTVNSRLAVLRALLHAAHSELDLPSDPYGETKQVSLDPAQPRDFKPEELRAILAWVHEHEPKWYPLFTTLTFTACRFGEIAALRWRDVAWEDEEISINKSVWRGHVTTTKTGKVRKVPLLRPVAEMLRTHRANPSWGPANAGEDELVFCSRRGTHHTANGFAPLIHRATEALGLPKRRGAAHRLRHSANNLLRQATGAEVVRAITGHSDSEMTWHYSHVQNQEKTAAMKAVYDRVVGAGPLDPVGDVGTSVGTSQFPENVIPLFGRNR